MGIDNRPRQAWENGRLVWIFPGGLRLPVVAGGAPDADDDDDDDQNDDDPKPTGITLEQLQTALAEQQTKTNAEIDRRINKVLEKVRSPEKDDKPDPTPAVKTGDRRYLKMAIRDEIAALPEHLRDLARTAALAYADQVVIGDGNEDDVAKQIVASTKTLLETSEAHFTERTRTDLQSRGLLKEEDAKAPKAKTAKTKDDGTKGPEDAMAQFNVGAEKAKERFEKKE